MAVPELLQDTRSGEACQAGAAGQSKERILDDVVEMMRGTEKLETPRLTLPDEEIVAVCPQVRLGGRPLPCPYAKRARHLEGGAEGGDETGVARGVLSADAVIEMEDA